jgi:hypothetical protein
MPTKRASRDASSPSSAERNAPANSEGHGGITEKPCSPAPPKERLPRIVKVSSGSMK